MKKPNPFSVKLGSAINSMLQNDATGCVLAFTRERGRLVPHEVDPESLSDDAIKQYEMIVFDGGDSHGSAWKHVFFPPTQQEIFCFDSPYDGIDLDRPESDTPSKREPLLSIVEHRSPNYSPRTYHNAQGADLTVALACDFGTAGEKLTHKAAGQKYLGVPIKFTAEETARMIVYHLKEKGLTHPTLNIAGNGIYTLRKKADMSQLMVNLHLTHTLALVNREIPIKKIISGGQTGVDIAGIVAARLLQIDAEATFPKGFTQRFEDGQDITRTAEDIRAEVEAMADAIREDLKTMIDLEAGARKPAPAPAEPTKEQETFDFGF